LFLQNARLDRGQLFLCSSKSVREQALLHQQVDFPPQELLIGGKMAAVQPVLKHGGDKQGSLVNALFEQLGLLQLFREFLPLGLQCRILEG
jgi:hypothetical protein